MCDTNAPQSTKVCRVCQEEKELVKFSNYVHANGKRYYKNICYYCKHRKQNLKKKYGITPLDYETMYEAQGGVCKICSSTISGNSRKGNFDIDHCHETGKVRGLLCNKCNKGLGHFQDNIELLLNAVAYLKDSK